MIELSSNRGKKDFPEPLAGVRQDFVWAMKVLGQVVASTSKAIAVDQKQAKAIKKALQSYEMQVTNAVESIRQWSIRNHGLLQEAVKAVEEWPMRQHEAVVKVARYGWYIDPEMPVCASTELARALDAGEVKEVTQYASQHVRDHLDRIEARLSEHYPHRRLVLVDAFDAHRKGKFTLSIPVLLSQADGIWNERFSTSLFRGPQRTDTSRNQRGGNQDLVFWDGFNIFEESIPMWMSEKERGPSFAQLNRHLVLHGESLDYGTEENSLRAISFVSWLCWILNWESKKAA